MPANLENQQWPQDCLSLSVPKKGNAKECSNYHIIAFISHARKVMLKIPDEQAGFRKGRGTRDQIANIHWIIEKAREFQKNIYFCIIDYAKAFDCGSPQTVENSYKDRNTSLPDLPLEKSVCRSGTNN